MNGHGSTIAVIFQAGPLIGRLLIRPSSCRRLGKGDEVVLAYALIGLLAAGFGVGIGQLVAALIDPAFAPISVVASSVIDLPPAVVKEWAVQTFGTSAKSVVVVGVAIAVLALAAVAGIVARRRLWLGILITDAVALLGILAALARPDDGLTAAVPTLAAGLASTFALAVLVRIAARRQPQQASVPPNTPEPQINRRALLIGGLSLAGVAAASIAAAQFVGSRTNAVASRVSTRLPLPGSPAAPLPVGVQAPITGIQPFVTPNANFYRIDTALVVPQVQAQNWTLRFSGLVRRPYTITYDDLLQMPMVERDVTIMCVSNPIGGNYIGNARWLGTPLMPLLEQAGIESSADQLFSTSVDGWTCSTPLNDLAEREPLLVIGMNGEPLPIDHGFPVRMVIPGLYGFISATKWVAQIEAATYADMPAYWTVRGWATDAPVLTGSKIEQPNPGAMKAGATNIGGVAWAMDGDGVSKVEVQVDEGPWQEANLAEVPNPVTWRQWWLPWDATPGSHVIRVRATNGLGELQTEQEADVIPSGATGWHTIEVEAA